MIISRTPVRISFFGGGTDYPSWYRQHGGQVLAAAINKYTTISCRYLPPFFEHRYRVVYSKNETVRSVEQIQHPAVRGVLTFLNHHQGLEIHHDGDLPAHSGLGTSSSFTVGLLHAVHALEGRFRSARQLAQEAIQVEQEVIREPVGSQDQVTTAFGGINRVRFFPDDTFDVFPIIIPPQRLEELRTHLVLLFTGISRFSSEIAASKIANMGQRERELTVLGEMVDQAITILGTPTIPITEFGRLLHAAWEHKRALSDKVATPTIDEIHAQAMAHGALGGKVLGAGGGGFMLFFVPPERQPAFLERFHKLIHVPFRFDYGGSRIVLYQPEEP